MKLQIHKPKFGFKLNRQSMLLGLNSELIGAYLWLLKFGLVVVRVLQ